MSVFIEDGVVNFEIVGLKDETQLLGPDHYLIRDNIYRIGNNCTTCILFSKKAGLF